MGDLRIGSYVAFVSKFWAVENVITRSRTATAMWMGPVSPLAIKLVAFGELAFI
jgi:hypothetical protein